MKLDYDAMLTSPRGDALQGQNLGEFLYDVLLASEHDMPSDKKLLLARLAKKVVGKEDITIEEAAIMKERALKYGTTAVVLSVESILSKDWESVLEQIVLESLDEGLPFSLLPGSVRIVVPT